MVLSGPLYYVAVLNRIMSRCCLCDLDVHGDTELRSPCKLQGAEGKLIRSRQEEGDESSGVSALLDELLHAAGQLSRKGAAESEHTSPTSPAKLLRSDKAFTSGVSQSGQLALPSEGAARPVAWNSLAQPIWGLVLPELSKADQCAFRRVCKEWRSVQSSSVRSLKPSELHGAQLCQLFPNLMALDLSACEAASCTMEGLSGAANLRSLKSLTLNGWTWLDVPSMRVVGSMTGLTTLRLARCPTIAATHVQVLASLRRLVLLSLTECSSVGDAALHAVSMVSTLTSLDLSRCQKITYDGVKELVSLQNLLVLNLGGCRRLSDEGVKHLSLIRSLASLRLAGCPSITDSGLRCLDALPNLQEINLAGCSNVSDMGVIELASFQRLASINLGGCRWVSDAGMVVLSHRSPTFTSLNLSFCKLITDLGIHHLSAVSTLKSLVIDGCRQITDMGISAAAKIRSLRLLSLAGCTQVGDHGMMAMSSLTALTHLDVTGCVQVSNAGLAQLHSLPLLKHVDITYCDLITEAAVQKLCAANSHVNVRKLS